MATVFVRMLLFISSYFPLALIFFFLLLGTHRTIAIGLLSAGLLGLVGLSIYLRKAQTLAPLDVTVQSVQRRDAEAMSYIVTYIIPFLAIPFTDWPQAVSLGVFFVVLGILYVNSNLIHINPVLNLAGYRLYEVLLEEGGTHSLITKRRVAPRQRIRVIRVGEDIFLEKEK